MVSSSIYQKSLNVSKFTVFRRNLPRQLKYPGVFASQKEGNNCMLPNSEIYRGHVSCRFCSRSPERRTAVTQYTHHGAGTCKLYECCFAYTLRPVTRRKANGEVIPSLLPRETLGGATRQTMDRVRCKFVENLPL